MVTAHFGHCESFMIFNAENNMITGEEIYLIQGIYQDSCLIS